MLDCLRAGHLNPASQHGSGRQARRVLESARDQLGTLLGASLAAPRRDHVIMTSGGTEANNLAVRGLVSEPGEVLVSPIEHPSALAAVEKLLERGFTRKWLSVTSGGHIDISTAREQISTETKLVCVMLANNEVGTLQDVATLARICSERGVPIHCDAVQVVGKGSVHFGDLGVSSLSFSAHKFHGPRGVGGLLVRQGISLRALLVGGSQQLGMRPGTESIASVVGMARALELAVEQQTEREARVRALRDRLESRLRAETNCVVVGEEPRLSHTTNVAFPGIDRQALVMALDMAGVECSTGSACTSGSSEPSHVLLAMGCPTPVVEGSIRLSLSAFTTAAEVDLATHRILAVVNDLRSRESR